MRASLKQAPSMGEKFGGLTGSARHVRRADAALFQEAPKLKKKQALP